MRKNAIALIALAGLASQGCGAIFNGGPATASAPPGVMIDGQQGTVMLDKKATHMVQYPDGRTCAITSSVSIGYVLLDVFLTGLVGVVIDGVTGDWKVLSGGCPGVIVN